MPENLSRATQQQMRRQLTAYFLITFAISWGIFASALAFDFAGSPVVILGVWGPTLSAFIVTALLYGTTGLKRFLGRVGVREGLK